VAKELQPFLIEERVMSNWRDFRTIELLYRFSGASVEVLAQAPGLYLWNERTWPRDLAIYAQDVCWLKTNTQNRWGFIYADVVPVHALLRDAPGIDLELHKPTLSIDGARVATLDEFFDEVSRSLIPGARWGRNLNAFNDILYGGFGTPEYGFVLVWQNAVEGKERLGEPLFSELVEIIEGHEHIELTLD